MFFLIDHNLTFGSSCDDIWVRGTTAVGWSTGGTGTCSNDVHAACALSGFGAVIVLSYCLNAYMLPALIV